MNNTEKHQIKVKDLKIGDQIHNKGAVRSVIPAHGGHVHVLVEQTPAIATHTWDLNGEIDIVVEVPSAQQYYKTMAEEGKKVTPGWWAVVDTYGTVINTGGKLAKHTSLDDALVDARHMAVANVGKKYAIVKLVTSVWARHGEPIAEREDFS